jgi:hypothetical protein
VMSDFSDAEDRALIQLVVRLSDTAGVIDWDDVVKQFPPQSKTRLALRQRLKTLKRTYGRNLRQFPSRFFRASDGGRTAELRPSRGAPATSSLIHRKASIVSSARHLEGITAANILVSGAPSQYRLAPFDPHSTLESFV